MFTQQIPQLLCFMDTSPIWMTSVLAWGGVVHLIGRVVRGGVQIWLEGWT